MHTASLNSVDHNQDKVRGACWEEKGVSRESEKVKEGWVNMIKANCIHVWILSKNNANIGNKSVTAAVVTEVGGVRQRALEETSSSPPQESSPAPTEYVCPHTHAHAPHTPDITKGRSIDFPFLPSS